MKSDKHLLHQAVNVRLTSGLRSVIMGLEIDERSLSKRLFALLLAAAELAKTQPNTLTPKVSAKDFKAKTIHVRVSPELYDLIRSYASNSGLSILEQATIFVLVMLERLAPEQMEEPEIMAPDKPTRWDDLRVAWKLIRRALSLHR